MSNKSGQKGYSFRRAIIIGSMSSIIWIIFAGSISGYFPAALGTIPIPFLCLFIAYHRRRIGALATMASGFIPWIVVIIDSMPGSSSNLFFAFLIPAMAGTGILITAPLIIAGIIIYKAPIKEEREKIERLEESKKQTEIYKSGVVLSESEVGEIVGKNIDTETFRYIPSLCPYCGSVNMKNSIAEKASNPRERQELGFIKRHLFNCNACNSFWFALEK